MNNIKTKKSFWSVFYNEYEDEILIVLTFMLVVGLPFILGFINIKIKIIDTNNEPLNFIIGFLSFYLLIIGIYLLYRIISLLYHSLWSIVNFIFKIKAMNRYRQIPLTENEFKLLDIKNIDEFIELIDSYISYDFNIYKTKYKEYIINYEDMIEMIKIYNKLKTISLEDMYEIQHYFLSLNLEISNNKLREKNFCFVWDFDKIIKEIGL